MQAQENTNKFTLVTYTFITNTTATSTKHYNILQTRHKSQINGTTTEFWIANWNDKS